MVPPELVRHHAEHICAGSKQSKENWLKGEVGTVKVKNFEWIKLQKERWFPTQPQQLSFYRDNFPLQNQVSSFLSVIGSFSQEL